MGQASSAYRIVLLVTEKDWRLAAATLCTIAGNTIAPAPITVMAPQAVADAVRENPDWEAKVHFIVSSENNYEGLFSAALRTLGHEDVILIRPGVVVPPGWDARLAASARRRDNIATVSPLCGRFANLDLPKASEIPAQCAQWVDLVDRTCYQQSSFRQPPALQFFEGCVYVRAEAIRASPRCDPADFNACAAALRYEHVIADHMFVGSLPGVSASVESYDPPQAIRPAFSRWQTLAKNDQAGEEALPGPDLDRAGCSHRLHVLHGWGGGLEHWVREYCWADRRHHNFVLKSAGTSGEFGSELRLYNNVDDKSPLATWDLSPSIPATALSHGAYRAVLSQIIEEYGIDSLLISSLVGHSLDVLRTDLPTVAVCHDFYPFCPVFNITYNGICTSCSEDELAACTLYNPLNRFFRNLPPASWRRLRMAFTGLCRDRHLPLITPSESARNHWVQLVPSLKENFTVIPHATRPVASAPLALDLFHDGRLRVIVLGSLAPQKGLHLFEAMAEDLARRADVYLIGCGEYGLDFQRSHGITVLREYVRDQLPAILARIQPDLALLLSIVPETFSYTLQELLELAVPVLATDTGSFSDRIRDRRDGFLCAPSAAALLERIQELDRNRHLLSAVHVHLCGTRPRPVEEMLSDYEALLQTPSWSPKAYFRRDRNYFAARDRVQIFWRPQGGNFLEEVSSHIYYRPGAKPERLHLPVPPLPYPPGQLRLDLGDRPGVRILKNVKLLDTSGATLWMLPAGGTHFDLQHDVRLMDTLPDGSLVMVATGSDPFLGLPVDEPALTALQCGGALEIEITAPPPEDYISLLCRPEDSVPVTEIPNGDLVVPYPAEEMSERERLIRILCHSLASSQMHSRMERQRLESLVTDVQNRSAAVQAALRDQLTDVYNSYSWRVTNPLRAVCAAILRLWPSLIGHPAPTFRKPE